MKLEILEQLGLSAREVSIYLALLKMGMASIRDIADEAGINRGTTYETLKGLTGRGIVSYFPKGKRRIFCAEPPERLLELAEEKRQSLEQGIEEMKHSLIPQLNHLKPDFNPGNVRFYEGDAGIELVLKDILNTVEQQEGKQYSVFSSKPIRQHLYRPFPNYTQQRIRKQINVRVIAIGEGGEDARLSERKWIDAKGKIDASYIAIYPPKVAMISLASRNYPVAVVIDSCEIASTQQIIFDTLWNTL
ncbi:TrmB family transcriptional regulator [Endozoicomonas euniceicola]|uniref:TrmB family transcriptional regulator n=1 Tax=Endozoicomonas euniceicola TaxID=1234143 RepID=A0ABY6GZD4_9GAMM|nr:helix-turn-helix domain-containing protein [Endozoicomonas euniceicola]UYM18172.1 TrmB family transcriptional regulator [Endozoicomonas euniceicola]